MTFTIENPHHLSEADMKSLKLREALIMQIVDLKLQKLPHYDNAFPMPAYETAFAAGFDVRACLDTSIVKLNSGETKLIPTGLAIAVPHGYEAQVRPRSGLAAKHQITVLNSPGTIDSDYRGEIKVILHNAGPNPYTVEHGDRIAQIVIAPVYRANIQFVSNLESTERGNRGFGSTGTK